MKFNPYQLRAFHSVASHGSFSSAAGAANVSQPTLSGQVKNLEERCGLRLFNRHKRGVDLTDAGQRLFQLTTQLETLERDIETLLSHEKQELAGRLVIGADAPYQIMPIVAAFKKSHPGVDISLGFGNSRWLQSALATNEADVIVAPNLPRTNRLYRLPLAPDQLRVFVNRNHRWAAAGVIRLEELTGETVILRERGSTTRAILDRALARVGLRLGNTIEIGSREAVREAVAAGLGVSVIPASELGSDDRFRFLSVGNAALTNTEYVACLSANQDREPIRTFIACCRN